MEAGLEGWDDLRERRLTIPASVVFRGFAQETVFLNIETGEYHGVDPIGARFIEVITGSPHLAAASEVLATEFEQPLVRIEDDLVSFVREMVSRGLLELQAASG